MDAGFILAGGTVSGKVVVDKNLNNRLDSQDLPMPGVLVQLHNMSGLLIDSKISDTNGEYSFYPVLEGQYYLVFKKMTGYIFADPYTTGNTNTDFDVDESISSGSTTYFNVYNLQTVGHIDAGLQDARGSLSGVVWLDANSNGLLDFEPGVGNVLVELISLETNQVVETTSSNDLGQYNFKDIIPSDYFIRFSSIPSHTFFTMPDIGTNDQIDSEVTGTNGVGTTMTITVNNFEKIYNINAGLTGYGTITTKVFKDENENGLDDVNEGGVPNILVRLLRNGQLIQERESDVNGLVTFDNVLMGDYSLEYEINEKLRFTDYKVGNDDAIDSDVNTINGNIGLTNEFNIHLDEHITNINAGLIDAYGSISGVIATDGDKDDMLDLSGIDDGIPMMIVIAKNVDGTSYISQTDENGYYSFNHLIIGDYYIQFLVMPGFLYSLPYIASDPLYDFDITGTNGPGTTDIITVTQGSSTVGINAGYIDSRATLRGKFFLDNNANGVYDNEDGFVKNRKVELIKSSNGLLVDYIDTDAYGNYNFDKVIPGNYFIRFTELNSDWTFTTANVGNNDSIDSDISGANGAGTSDVFSLDYNEVKEDVYGGILGFGDISSTVFFDANENGIFDLTEIGVKGVKVTLIDANNMEVSSKITSVDGKFKFANIQAGIYHLKFEIDESYRFTTPNAGNNEFLDSDAIPSNISTGFTHDFSMIIDDTVDEVSAGLILAKNTINGYVVNDLNRNNIKDASDAMMSLTKVSLFKSNGTFVTETMTNTDGYFEMNDVVVGDYYLLFEPFEGYVYSQAHFSGDDNVDFQVTGNKGLGTTDVFQLTGQTTTYTFNAGYIDARGTIQGMVWYDKNNNGIKESNESFVANHTVKLYDEAGTLKDEKTTNQLGNYQFDQLLFDNYYVVFSDLASDQFWSPANQTSDETLDCDVTQSIVSNSTDYIEIIEFSQVAGVNAGISGYASISGTVFEDANDNGILDTDDFGLENFDVQLLTSAGTVFKTTKSLADGTYSFNQLTPGNYKIQISIPSGYQFVAANQGADDSVDSEIVNVAGQTGSTDLLTVAYQMNLSDIHIGLLPSLGTISGKVVYDVNSNNQLDSPDAGIDNHIVNLYATDGTLKATKMTNAEGKYIFNNVEAGSYYIKVEEIDQYLFSTPHLTGNAVKDFDITNANGIGTSDVVNVVPGGSISDINAGYQAIPTFISGLVYTDSNGDGIYNTDDFGLENYKVYLVDTSYVAIDSTLTDTLGNYSFMDVNPGMYFVHFNADTLTEKFSMPYQGTDPLIDSDVINEPYFGFTDTLFVLSSGQIEGINAALLGKGTIQSTVFNDENKNGLFENNENGVANVQVQLLDNTGMVVQSKSTNTSGVVSFTDVFVGDYSLNFRKPLYYLFSNPNAGADDIDSDVIELNGQYGKTENFFVFNGDTINNYDAGIYYEIPKESAIRGVVWDDKNPDGIRKPTEPGLADVRISLIDENLDEVAVDTTDVNGNYELSGLIEGIYYLKIKLTNGRTTTKFLTPVPTDTTSIFDGVNGKGTTSYFYLGVQDTLENYNAGIANELMLIGLVWEDTNVNGIRENNEPYVPNINVHVLDKNGEIVDTKKTGVTGNYIFNGLTAGDYEVLLELPTGYVCTKYKIGQPNMDNDFLIDGTTGLINYPASVVTGIDAGIVRAASIGDYVWIDYNGNGFQQSGEPGMNNIELQLYDADDNLVKTTVSGNDLTGKPGFYNFDNLQPGAYYVKVILPENYEVGTYLGIDGPNDSDISGANGEGTTNTLTMGYGQKRTDIDAGLYVPGSIGDRVWLDLNANGIQDEGEPGVGGITVELFNSFNQSMGTVMTDSEGMYMFMGLPQGLYYMSLASNSGLTYTTPLAGNDPTKDSNVNSDGVSALVNLAYQVMYMDLDAGILPPGVTLPDGEEVAVSAKDKKFNSFSAFPNPAMDYFWITNHTDVPMVYQMYDQNGQFVKSISLNGFEKRRVDITELRSGDYLIYANWIKGVERKHLIVVR